MPLKFISLGFLKSQIQSNPLNSHLYLMIHNRLALLLVLLIFSFMTRSSSFIGFKQHLLFTLEHANGIVINLNNSYQEGRLIERVSKSWKEVKQNRTNALNIVKQLPEIS